MGDICEVSMYNTTVQKALRNVAEITVFEDILNSSTLSDLDKQIFRMHYLQEHDFAYIADELGYSESGIRKRHGKAIKKLSKII